MSREVAHPIFIILLMSSSFLTRFICFLGIYVSSLRRHSLELPDFLFNVDSLLFRSAVQLQLHPWNFFSLDSWVSATIFLYISYFLGFHSCFIFFLNYLLHGTRIRGQLFESWKYLKISLFCFHTWLIAYVEFYIENKFLSELWEFSSIIF